MILIRENVERHTDNIDYAKALQREGYRLIDGSISEQAETKPLDKMKVDELKSIAKSKGIEGADSFTKKELLDVLKEVNDEPDEESE